MSTVTLSTHIDVYNNIVIATAARVVSHLANLPDLTDKWTEMFEKEYGLEGELVPASKEIADTLIKDVWASCSIQMLAIPADKLIMTGIAKLRAKLVVDAIKTISCTEKYSDLHAFIVQTNCVVAHLHERAITSSPKPKIVIETIIESLMALCSSTILSAKWQTRVFSDYSRANRTDCV